MTGPNHPYYKETEDYPGHSQWRWRYRVDGMEGTCWWEALGTSPLEYADFDHAEIRSVIRANDDDGDARWCDE